MKKVKTKRTPKDQESLIRKAQKDLEIEYLRRFKFYTDSLIGAEHFEKLDKTWMKTIYQFRMRMPNFIFKDSSAFSPQMQKFMKSYLDKALKEMNSEVELNGKHLKMDEYLVTWQTYTKLFPDLVYRDLFNKYPNLEASFMEKLATKDSEGSSLLVLLHILMHISHQMSSPRKIVNLRYETVFEEFMYAKVLKQVIYASIYYPEFRNFNINSKHRPAQRFGLNELFGKFQWFSFTGKQLGLKNESENQIFEVFIQNHAVLRFAERMQGCRNYEVSIYLYYSFDSAEIVRYKNTYLVSYYFTDYKLGYFVGEIVENCFLIKTFLFLTQLNTPEGDALSEKLGTSIHDIEYLNIGKLSTFIEMNSKSADEMYEHFSGTGCESILEFKKEFFDIFARDSNKEISLTKYLNLDKTDAELDELLESKADELGYNFRNLRFEKALKVKVMKS